MRVCSPYERVTLIVDLLDDHVDATVEVAVGCPSWFDAACYIAANMTDHEFRGYV